MSGARFDHLILGGGSAGCVLAARLSADPARRVLLVEAGEDTPPGREPAAITAPAPVATLHGTRFLWPGLRARRVAAGPEWFYEQGRVLGGGSAVNAQVGNRGLPADYDEWAALGADGWGWADVLPFFRALEADADCAGPLHGQEGPLPIGRVPRALWPPFSRALAAALAAQGWPDIGDQNAVFADGHFAPAYTNTGVATAAARRASVAMAYLTPAVRARPNLTILTGAFATRLLLDGTRAAGAEIEHGGALLAVQAGEVILALGALHSPAMLLRAGIGPAAELRAMGIAPLLDLPVGRNLRDHAGTHLCAWVPPAARAPDGLRKSGHVALRFSSGLPGAPHSDLYMHSGVSSSWHGAGRRIAYFYLWLNKPDSAGRLALRGPGPRQHPVVAMNLLGAPGDAARLASGVRQLAAALARPELAGAMGAPFAMRLSPVLRAVSLVNRRNRAMQGVLGRLLDGPAPLRALLLRRVVSNAPPLDALLADGARLEAHLRAHATSVSHVSGTCRMGRRGDPAAVTDAQGRVHGAQGLRVADASLMPTLPRANTNLPTVMIAEKLSAAILAHPLPSREPAHARCQPAGD